jgi:hypothetical protein
MKTQKIKTVSELNQTYIVSRAKSKTVTEKFIDWFRSFLESSE